MADESGHNAPDSSIRFDEGVAGRSILHEMGREMTTYRILDSELDTMSFLNKGTTVAFSVAGWMTTNALSVWLQYSESTTEFGKFLATYGVVGLTFVATLSFVFGMMFNSQRRSIVTRIRRESVKGKAFA